MVDEERALHENMWILHLIIAKEEDEELDGTRIGGAGHHIDIVSRETKQVDSCEEAHRND